MVVKWQLAAQFRVRVRTCRVVSLFLSRLKTLWSFYMRSRGCNDFDTLVDLIVADRLNTH